jgi:hypothetical protein
MPTLEWNGKAAVKAHLDELPAATLRRVPALSCGDVDSGNLLVQGDNLQALGALLPRYAGRIKCIYIDPPYNTGSESWLYNDNVTAPPMRRWLEAVVGAQTSLDRHDRWLCMMYPRLVLLRRLLRDDGVVLVSIDDGEVHHLRMLMDEVFGAACHLSTFVWRTAGNFDNQAKIKHCHEYVLAYALDPARFAAPRVVDPSVGAGSKLKRDYIQNTIVKNGPKNPVSEMLLPAGFPASVRNAHIAARDQRWPHYRDAADIVDGRLLKPVRVASGWSSRTMLEAFIAAGFEAISDSRGQATRFVITASGAIESLKQRRHASHVLSVLSELGSTQSQSATLAAMGLKFPFPKPLALVKYLLSLVDDKDAIVLDSFAGSGTTAQAALELNAADGGTRRCVLVEMDEGIAQHITAPRLRQLIAGYRDAQGRAVAGLGGGFDYCELDGKEH